MRYATHFMRSFRSQSCAASFVAALVTGAVALGDPMPQTQPTVPPQPEKILVLPFETIGGRPSDSWIARSIQESLLTDLMISAREPVVSSVATAQDSAAAGEIGHKLGARYVVYGQVHIGDNALRVTGQILATNTDSAVAVLKATAPINDLFSLEDALGAQAQRAVTMVESPGTNPAPQQPVVIQPAEPVQPTPYLPESAPLDSGTYDAPFYPPSPYDAFYPGWYPYYPLFIQSNFGHRGFGRSFHGRGSGSRGFGTHGHSGMSGHPAGHR